MSDDNKEGAAEPVTEHFVGYLCRAWGESDRLSAELARDLEGVSRFMVREWLGEEDAVDYDGTPTIPRLMAEWEEHDWKDEPLWSAEFEIGGVSVEHVDCTVATPPAPSDAENLARGLAVHLNANGFTGVTWEGLESIVAEALTQPTTVQPGERKEVV